MNSAINGPGNTTGGPVLRFSADERVLVVQAGNHACALRLSQVSEVMRPLPIEPLASAPETVLGLSVIRGVPVPVVSLGALFGQAGRVPTRFVVVESGAKHVALAVDAVLGIHEFTASDYRAMPALLREAAAGAVERIHALDSDLFWVLNTSAIVPSGLLEALEERKR